MTEFQRQFHLESIWARVSIGGEGGSFIFIQPSARSIRETFLQSFAHDALHCVHDLVERQLSAIENDGVHSGNHRCDVSRGVTCVTRLLCVQDFVERDLESFCFKLAMPAAGALDRIGEQKKFASGLRKCDGSLVTPFTHDIATRRDLTLQFDEFATHYLAAGDLSRRGCNLWRTNQRSDVFPVEDDSITRQIETQILKNCGGLSFIGEITLGAQSKKRDSPVHGARVEKIETQPTRQEACRAALSCASGAVDGYDHGMCGDCKTEGLENTAG